MYKVLTAHEALMLSVCEVTSDNKQLVAGRACRCFAPDCDGLLGHMSAGLLCDLRMGPRTPGERCATCLGSYWECPGHPGHVTLAQPVFARHFVGEIARVLRRLCSRCMSLPAGYAKCRDDPGYVGSANVLMI